MDTAMHDLIQQLPGAELHLHLEGTLEPEHIFSLAQRNGIELEHETPADMVAACDSHDPPSFRKISYAAMDVLHRWRDRYELTPHCEVNQKDIHAHIREGLDLIEAELIDDRINAPGVSRGTDAQKQAFLDRLDRVH